LKANIARGREREREIDSLRLKSCKREAIRSAYLERSFRNPDSK
jgi:hypothetical protein